MISFQIGTDNSQEILEQDLSTLTYYKSDQEIVWGFKHGWKGNEIRRPLLNSTFVPEFVTLNTVLDSQPVGYIKQSKCKVPKKKIKPEKIDSTPIIIAGCVFLGLGLIVFCIVWIWGRRRRR